MRQYPKIKFLKGSANVIKISPNISLAIEIENKDPNIS